MSTIHLHDELAQTEARVVVETRFGPVTGGRAKNGAAVFLGKSTDASSILLNRFESLELPYALAPERFKNPVALPPEFRYQNREYIVESSCELGVS